jgi:hypothetical protein
MSPRSQQTLTTSMSQQSTASVAQTLKNQMLRVMGDKLVNSLRRSTITSPAQVRFAGGCSTAALSMKLYWYPSLSAV